MSTSLLLPCSPPAHRTAAADRAARAPPRISLGSFSSYSACQGPSKTPLLKSRRPSPQPVIVPRSPSESALTFVQPGLHLSQVGPRPPSAPHRDLSPPRHVYIPLEYSHQREVPPPVRKISSPAAFYRDVPPPRKVFLPHPKVTPKSFSESSSSLSPLSPLSPNIPTFPCRLPSPTSPPSYAPSQRSQLKKSQSTLIMPSLLTLLRPEPAPAAAPLPRDTSSRSLNDPSLPSPLIRKCQTMVTLSGSANSTSHTTSKVVKDKRSRFSFFRRISSSKSSSSLQSQALRKSPSANHMFQRYRRNSGGGMWPHLEHPEEGKNSDGEAGVSEKSTSHETEGCAASPAEEERLWEQSGGCSRCPSAASIPPFRRLSTITNDGVFCKLCLTDVSIREMYQLQQCQCRFCTYCMCMYTTLKIREGEAVIECPDSNCDCSGDLTLEEVESIVGKELLHLHLKFRQDREIDADPLRTWCPKPGCDTVVPLTVSKLDGRPQCCLCSTCASLFCASCSSMWHPGKPCNRIANQLGVPLNDAIKRCPRCKVPIERDAGCAQMQCKKCKHVFCWYCLASLEDDFLLRHYDKGPCKNKLGHSRASVLWHRAQVVVIFAGFGLLLVIASPLLLFVGPCLLCRSCRSCTGTSSSSSSRPESEDEPHSGIKYVPSLEAE